MNTEISCSVQRLMKEYTIQVGEVFTKEKALELKEYLELKDEESKCPKCKFSFELHKCLAEAS